MVLKKEKNKYWWREFDEEYEHERCKEHKGGHETMRVKLTVHRELNM